MALRTDSHPQSQGLLSRVRHRGAKSFYCPHTAASYPLEFIVLLLWARLHSFEDGLGVAGVADAVLFGGLEYAFESECSTWNGSPTFVAHCAPSLGRGGDSMTGNPLSWPSERPIGRVLLFHVEQPSS